MIKNLGKLLVIVAMLASGNAFAVLPNIFATQPTGNVAASLLDQNFTFLENQGVQALTTTGSSNSYVATPADVWVTGYSSYSARALTVIPNFTNTGASTINVSTLGSASIYKNISGTATALASGDMVSGSPAILICDGANFLLANPTPTSAGGGAAMVLLSTQTISSPTASVSDTTHITNAYTHYVWEISNLTTSNNGVDGLITVKQGGSFIGGSSYSYAGTYAQNDDITGNFASNGVAFFNVTGGRVGLSSTSTNPSIIRFEFWQPAVSSQLGIIFNAAQNITGRFVQGSGNVLTSAATTGIKFAPASGNIATATVNLYGIQ